MIPIQIHIGSLITHQQLNKLPENINELLFWLYQLNLQIPPQFCLSYQDNENDRITILNQDEYLVFKSIQEQPIILHIEENQWEGSFQFRKLVLEYQIGQQFNNQINFLESSLNQTQSLFQLLQEYQKDLQQERQSLEQAKKEQKKEQQVNLREIGYYRHRQREFDEQVKDKVRPRTIQDALNDQLTQLQEIQDCMYDSDTTPQVDYCVESLFQSYKDMGVLLKKQVDHILEQRKKRVDLVQEEKEKYIMEKNKQKHMKKKDEQEKKVVDCKNSQVVVIDEECHKERGQRTVNIPKPILKKQESEKLVKIKSKAQAIQEITCIDIQLALSIVEANQEKTIEELLDYLIN